ncbi:MAG: hypothetical protein HY303_02500 [Candidatus Wallbacteria bacterium]|nr:hypothetical protein [Candidatus Wallbacteria bacterium]
MNMTDFADRQPASTSLVMGLRRPALGAVAGAEPSQQAAGAKPPAGPAAEPATAAAADLASPRYIPWRVQGIAASLGRPSTGRMATVELMQQLAFNLGLLRRLVEMEDGELCGILCDKLTNLCRTLAAARPGEASWRPQFEGLMQDVRCLAEASQARSRRHAARRYLEQAAEHCAACHRTGGGPLQQF